MTACALTLSLLLAFVDSKTATIKELAKQGPGSIPQIVPYVSDESVPVRREAVKAIAELGTTASIAPLLKATTDNDAEVASDATDGLVDFYLPGYIKTGISGMFSKAGTAIKSRFAEVNDQVIDGYVTVRPDVIQAIGKIAASGANLEARANAARALGILRADAALPDLAAALRTKDSTVIYEVLKAFEKIRDPKAAQYFTYLLKDLDPKVQSIALETAGVLGSRDSLPAMRDVLQSARDIRIQRAALSAIGKIPDPANREIYEHFVDVKDADLRGDAAEGFARLKDPRDYDRMQRAFADEKKTAAKLGFAFAAVNLGNRDTTDGAPLQYLVSQLRSKFFSGSARGYLIELLRDQKTREAVYPMLRDSKKEEKVQLADIFGISGGEDTIKFLQVLEADPSGEVQNEANGAMRTLKARLGK